VSKHEFDKKRHSPSGFPFAKGEKGCHNDYEVNGSVAEREAQNLKRFQSSAIGTSHHLPNVEDDTELVAAVLRRDRKGTAEFVSLHADGIYAYVRNRLPRPDLADDIVQEVFVAGLENLSKFQGTSPLRFWLLGIARHKVEDYYRARLREAASSDEEDAELLSPAVTPDFDEWVDRERLALRVQKVLRSLPEIYSLVLLWRYWEHRSAGDMAAQIGRTEKAVERLLARAREQFKRRWNNE
jgi:RNA polymerase sigma-70 factor (ECF subfamily)